ncbi:MAG: hypothetical protein JSV03_07630 [Planctomycetota bacterium]|nr:MAG: hypothetical protein JSV03_07630 [Planctomycetota bacterium]
MRKKSNESKWSTIVFLSAVVTFFMVSSSLADNLWEGDESNEWTTPGNWSLGHVPDWGDGWIVVSNAGTVNCDTSLGSAGWAQYLWEACDTTDTTIEFNLGPESAGQHFGTSKQYVIGSSPGYTSTTNLNSGDLKIGMGSAGDRRLYLQGTGTAVFNASGNSYLFHRGMRIGQTAGGTGIFTLSDNARHETWGDIWIGNQGTGTLNIEGGSFDILGGTYLDVGVFNDGQLIVTGGQLNITAGSLLLGDEPGVTGTLTISAGRVNPKYITAGLDGNGIINVNGGELWTNNWIALGSIQSAGVGGTGTLNVSGGHVACGSSSLVIGEATDGAGGGHGILNQTGGLIGIYSNNSSLILGEIDGATPAQSAEVNLLGGETYSWAPPLVNMGWVNIDGGKLHMNFYKIQDLGGPSVIESMITAGQIKGADTDTDPSNFRIRVEQDSENPFGDKTYMVQYPIPACESRVFPNLYPYEENVTLKTNETTNIEYTIMNYGESESFN